MNRLGMRLTIFQSGETRLGTRQTEIVFKSPCSFSSYLGVFWGGGGGVGKDHCVDVCVVVSPDQLSSVVQTGRGQ